MCIKINDITWLPDPLTASLVVTLENEVLLVQYSVIIGQTIPPYIKLSTFCCSKRSKYIFCCWAEV